MIIATKQQPDIAQTEQNKLPSISADTRKVDLAQLEARGNVYFIIQHNCEPHQFIAESIRAGSIGNEGLLWGGSDTRSGVVIQSYRVNAEYVREVRQNLISAGFSIVEEYQLCPA